MGYIAGIGGANMDILGKSVGALSLGQSNPGELRMSMGGVSRNICENLAMLGLPVKLVTVMGDDMYGRSIMEGCKRVGIDMSAAHVIEGENSSSYISVVNESGELVLAMSDMRIIKNLDAALVDESRVLLSNADLVVVDGNLSMKTVERLTEVCISPLYLDTTSPAWAKEIAPLIGSFDTVKPNLRELEALSGCPVENLGQIVKACDVLLKKGVRRVFVTMGQQGMLYKGREGVVHRIARPYPDVVDVTGAGEAAMAGIIWASRQGMTADEIVCVAMAASMLAIASPDTNTKHMSPEAIAQIMEDYII